MKAQTKFGPLALLDTSGWVFIRGISGKYQHLVHWPIQFEGIQLRIVSNVSISTDIAK